MKSSISVLIALRREVRFNSVILDHSMEPGMWKIGTLWLGIALLASCATPVGVPGEVHSQLAPTGKLRVGLNFGNVLLVSKGQADGDPRGVVVDVARELGARIGVPVQFIAYERPGLLAEAAKSGDWDIAFLAVEPARATMINFSPPYVEIEASYLVRKSATLQTVEDVDRAGVRIAVAGGSAYDLFLTRSLKAAQLIRTQVTDAAVKELRAERADAVAGIKQILSTYAESASDLRVIDGRFTAIQQAIGTPIGRDDAAKYLRTFVGDIIKSGFVANAIEKNGARGLSVAP